MPVFVSIIGHNGTGKTTLAKKLENELGFNRINGDAFRLFAIKEIRYFKDLDLSHPNGRHESLSPLVFKYRTDMSATLLGLGENVIMEGSGLLKDHRQIYLDRIKKEVPATKTVLIVCDVPHNILVGRLKLRDEPTKDESWQDMLKAKESMFEAPASDEVDVLLTYTQDNYDEIKTKLKAMLETASRI